MSLKEVREEARLREEINESLNGYTDNLKKISKLQKTHNHLVKLVAEQEAKYAKTRNANDLATLNHLKIIEAETKKSLDLYKKIGKEATAMKVASEFVRGAWTDTAKVLGGISNIYGKILNKTKYITEIDKKIKMSALSMGILDTQTKSFRKSLANASAITNDFGINQGQLAEMQAAYSQELGRTVMLGTEGLVAIAEMAAATGLGAEGAAKMSADFELIGYSAEKTSDFIEQTMNDSSKMGLNASKVVKAMSNGMKLLNKYNFKGGVAGLKKMAEITTKLGVDMDFATGMADKLFDIEGAVQMSAELQVLGGSFARLADPFHLMFMARNDVAGLTEEIGKAAEEFVSFNAATGNFDMSAMGMHQLRKIAEQTGLEFESLVTAGKNASKFTMIKSQVSFNMDDEDREFLANTAKLDEKGRAYIEVNGEKKFLDMLGSEGDKFIKTQIAEKKSLAERAKSALTFDETITNFINKVKELFIPILPVLDKFADTLVTSLKPAFDDLKATIGSKEFQDGIKDFATGAIEVAKTIGGLVTWFIKNPGLGITLALAGMAGHWYLMGLSLGAGFNTVAGKGIGGLTNLIYQKGTAGKFYKGGQIMPDGQRAPKGGTTVGGTKGGFTKFGGRMLGSAGLGIAGFGADIVRSNMEDPESTGGKWLGVGSAALKGASMGMMFGPWGAAIGGVLG
ncbi:MAG: hypothetical protein EBR67_10440, partial [Proteobacteria bacterium]|nr:hypothetical protein [Pseudomonadota bacterium]